MKLKKEQIWKEVDNRFTRHVRITGFDMRRGFVFIQNIETGRKTKAKRCRFNGKAHGYIFVCDDLSLLPSGAA